MAHHSEHGSHGSNRGGDHSVPAGLSLAANGLRFVPSETRFRPQESTDWTFRIVDNGSVVTDFETAHGQRAHLIVVRRDLTRFQHRHPELESDGTWRLERLAFPDPGVYRAFVDVVVDGQATTLGYDLFASDGGDAEARPASSRRDTANGYEVELLTDNVVADQDTDLTFEVRSAGGNVVELDRYLGALGHLVALREGDLAYLHVHPEETAAESGRAAFRARFPTPGRYRLFLQTKPAGTLITTRFDVRVDA